MELNNDKDNHRTEIYGLLAPGSAMIWYVGKTKQGLKARLEAEIQEAKSGCISQRSEWIRGLLADGKKPTVVQIDVCSAKKSKAREQYWIDHYRAINPELKNANFRYSLDNADCSMEPDNALSSVSAATTRIYAKTQRKIKLLSNLMEKKQIEVIDWLTTEEITKLSESHPQHKEEIEKLLKG